MNKNYGIFGAAVQAARGTAAAAPTVSFHASDDSDGISAEKSMDNLALTIGGRSTTVENYIKEVKSTADVKTIGFADTLGMMLYAAMGADTVTGSAAPYAHDIKAGASIPYLTFFQQVGSTSAALQQLKDAKVDEMKMTCEGVAPMGFEFSLAGTNMSYLAATEWNGPDFSIADGYFKMADATLLFSLLDGEPVAVPAGIVLSKLEIGIKNNLSAQAAMGIVEPIDQQEESADVSVSLEGKSDSTDLYRKVITGSATGTAVTSRVVTGSLQITFQHTVNSAWTFVVKIPAIPWVCDVMGVSTDGGPFDLKMSTDSALDLGAGAAEFILTNDVAKYEI